MSGADIRAEVAAGIAEAAVETGTTGLGATIIRDGVTEESNYAAITAAPATSEPITAVLSRFTLAERAGGQIEAGDVKVLVASEGLSFPPTTADRIRVSGQVYNIVDVMPLAPGGIDLMYTVQARGAGVSLTVTPPPVQFSSAFSAAYQG